MSRNLGNIAPLVSPSGLSPGLPLVPPPRPQQNPQVYIKKISINKPFIFIEVINRARKWLANI